MRDVKIGKRVWNIRIREWIRKLYDFGKDPRTYTVWANDPSSIMVKFSINFEELECIKLYADPVTGDIWARSGSAATRIYCEGNAEIRW